MTDKRVTILGIPFIHINLEQMADKLHKHASNQQKAFVVTANPEIALAAHQDKKQRELLAKANYITADGIGIVKAAELLGTPLPGRVTGFDLFLSLLTIANQHGYRIYLLGAKEEVLAQTIAEIHTRFPNVQVAGSHHGFFDWEDETIEQEIQKTKPDFVFVALGFPRQEKWIAERIHMFEKGVFIGIGGSFDVLAGVVQRAPVMWQKLNVEWLYRLIQQPSRWRRMLALPKFAVTILKEKAKRR